MYITVLILGKIWDKNSLEKKVTSLKKSWATFEIFNLVSFH